MTRDRESLSDELRDLAVDDGPVRPPQPQRDDALAQRGLTQQVVELARLRRAQMAILGHGGGAQRDGAFDVERRDRRRPVDDGAFELVADPDADDQPTHQQDGQVGREEPARE
jgi:hypothetical protein